MTECDVVVVGAGLAGLSCAVDLCALGFEVIVLEGSDAVGGRVRTDTVDHMLLDRGFQQLNPAYPALQGFVDIDALDLQQFKAGAVVARGGKRAVLADPRRSPWLAMSGVSPSTGSPLEKARFVLYVLRTAFGSEDQLTSRPDLTFGEALDRADVTGRLRRSVIEPFMAGVLGEEAQETSRLFVDLLWRTFVRGTPGLPAAGMQALPTQLADRLAEGVLHLGVSVRSIVGTSVLTDAGTWTGRAVVVAADGDTAAELTGLPHPRLRASTTYYHQAKESPAKHRMIHLDGDRGGPVTSTAVVSDVAPSYCSDGALISSSVLGVHHDPRTLELVEWQLARIYGVSTRGWEHVATYAVPGALPAMLPPLTLRQPVAFRDGLFVTGDHRDTASIQGAITSGRRTATAVGAGLSAQRTAGSRVA
ncbi:MAG: FAD-dependent oxidoreductase [Nocardioidaceae bacterium]|nr:FAD-dependent oxidoreductase [Nocardioidaceae bacterium]